MAHQLRKLILIGAGGLGASIVEMARASARPWEILLVDRDGERAAAAAFAAAGLGLSEFPVVRAAQIDATDADALSALIRAEHPDAVVNIATMLPVDVWWGIAARPDIGEEFDRLGFGPWIALHLAIADRVALAVREAEPGVVFVNAAYPDVINAVLHEWHGITPLGAGNIRLLEPGARRELARMWGIPAVGVDVRLSAHYVHVRAALRRASALPTGWRLRAWRDGEEVALDTAEAESVILRAGAAVPMGADSHLWTALSMVEDLTTFLGGPERSSHMAGPDGAIGGHAVRLREGGAALLPTDGSDDVLGERESLTDSSRLDGIEGVHKGTVLFTDEAALAYERLAGRPLQALTRDRLPVITQEQLSALRHIRDGERASR